ncbi:MAG: hypothetical protein AAFX09_08110 [Pseudomonadota bacterium]
MEYDRDRFTVWKLPHWALVHWVVNPGLAINELIFGQRIPKVTLVERNPDKALNDRQFAPCPSCGAINDGRVYGASAFGNYAGLACIECGEKIPTLKNALTWLLLMVTWPVWKPLERRYGPAMLARQHERLKAVQAEGLPEKTKVSGLSMGLFFGLAMGVFFFFQQFLFTGDPMRALTIALGSALACGLFFGLVMKLWLSMRSPKPSDARR